MSQWLLWAIGLSIFLVLVIIQVIVKSKNPVRKAAAGVFVGVLSLIAVNIAGIYTGVKIPISLLSLGISAVAGIPGVTMILLLNMII